MIDAAKDLCDILISYQVTDQKSEDFGALSCPAHEKAHPRSGEAVFPFSHFYSETKEKKYLEAALRLVRWLSRTQRDDGSWGHDPGDVPELATVSLTIALCHAYQLIAGDLDGADRAALEKMIWRGADYIHGRMDASRGEARETNCLALSCAALQVAHTITGEERYAERARENASSAVERISEEGFFIGEKVKDARGFPSVDVAFDLEIGLGGLTVYSCLTGDKGVRDAVVGALKNHLNFLTPSGYIDGSWGVRMHEWTLLGNVEGNGCQIPFLALRNLDARFQRAAGQNLRFMLKNMMRDGLVTTGPHADDKPDYVHCIKPSVLRANALCQTLVYSCGVPLGGKGKWILPAEEKGWVRFYKSLNVVQVRTSALLCTITGCGARKPGSVCPTGGTISHLWNERFGTVQAASAYGSGQYDLGQTSAGECLACRIEARVGETVFSNIFEPGASISVSGDRIIDDKLEVVAKGKLRSPDGEDSGLGYTIVYRFDGARVAKEITVQGPGGAKLRSIEPIVFEKGCDVLVVEGGVEIRHAQASSCIVTAYGGGDMIRPPSRNDVMWSSFPALYALPVVIEPGSSGDRLRICYTMELRDWE